LGGHKDLQSIWPKYYRECHGIVFMVDATDPSRLLEAQKTFSSLVSNDLVEGVPIVVLANKEDLPTALKEHEVKEIFNPVAASLMARESKVLAVSALQGVGIREAIEWLLRRIELNADSRPPNKV
jgi:ADP-ribosylation factor related protein 1